jgi:hypothetical protein
MNKLVLNALLALLLLAIAAPQVRAQTSPAAQSAPHSEELLTNKAVIEMVAAKLPEEVIITKIQTSKTNFDFSTPALVELNKNGVSPSIVRLMMFRQSSPPQQSTDAPATPAETTPESKDTTNPIPAKVEAEQPRPNTEQHTYLIGRTKEAASLCSATLKENAKDPSSFKLDDGFQYQFGRKFSKDDLFIDMAGYARNSFGAVLRGKYTCIVTCKHDQPCHVRKSEER